MRDTSKADVLYESECEHIESSIQEFVSHLENGEKEHFVYMAYKHMATLFENQPEIFKAIDWSMFGLEGYDGRQSTLWIGSEGAHTPAHQDSYSSNIVAQLYGRKLWVLFPPDDEECLYPTRVPYEESSTFTRVNVRSPDVNRFPKFKQCHPYVTMLNPGDVLVVPKHWWHYVHSIGTTISVNAWIPSETDDKDRLHEAATLYLASRLLPNMSGCINPNEKLENEEDSLRILNLALSSSSDTETQKKHLKSTDSSKGTFEEIWMPESCTKSKRLTATNIDEFLKLMSHKTWSVNASGEVVGVCRFEGNQHSKCKISQEHNMLTHERVAQCILHPAVVRNLCELLNFKKDNA